ncbi:MAG: hypothetical protein CVU41_16065 [Chloroflexi bacterium HGW-Chloroflexi-3]|nr:MAG: hypothetical protein CVU41_16065 [Chloroflexi bacterium HGW-Chloroflexi-3]
MTDFDIVLDECLQMLASGQETSEIRRTGVDLRIEDCLSRFPQYATDLKPLLEAASQVKQSYAAPLPNGARARMRVHLTAQMRAHPRRKPAIFWKIPLPLHTRLALGLLVVFIAFLSVGTAFAQFAQPGDALYGWKRASEQVWRFVHPDPLEADLALVQRRVDELIRATSDGQNQAFVVAELRLALGSLAIYKAEEDQLLVEAALAGHWQALQQAGLNVAELDILFNREEPQWTIPSLTPTTSSTDVQAISTIDPSIDRTLPPPTPIQTPTLIIPTDLPIPIPTLIPTWISP